MKYKKPLIILGGLILAGGLLFGEKQMNKNKKLFQNPKNLSQKITGYLIENKPKRERWNVWDMGRQKKLIGAEYFDRFLLHNCIYEISFKKFEKGNKCLIIDVYFTNQNYSEIKNIEDIISQFAKYGVPCVLTKKSFRDWNVDGHLDTEHIIFKKNKKGENECFREGDIKRNRKSLTQYIFSKAEGKSYLHKITKEKHTKTPVYDIKYQYAFEDLLEIIGKHYQIK